MIGRNIYFKQVKLMDHSHHHHSQHEHQSLSKAEEKGTAMPSHHEKPATGEKIRGTHQHPAAGGHDKHAGHHTEDFLKRFWICLILTLPILLLSQMIQHWFGFRVAFPGDRYVLSGLGSLLFFYGGWPFLTGMIREIRYKAMGMMTLVALAISVAYLYSVAITFGLEGMDFYWELATLIDIMLLGHWLEMRSQMAASNALQTLIELLPSNVHVERNGTVTDIELKDLTNNDVVLIKPGEKYPPMDSSSMVILL